VRDPRQGLCGKKNSGAGRSLEFPDELAVSPPPGYLDLELFEASAGLSLVVVAAVIPTWESARFFFIKRLPS